VWHILIYEDMTLRHEIIVTSGFISTKLERSQVEKTDGVVALGAIQAGYLITIEELMYGGMRGSISNTMRELMS
jgi:hypothetical protein